MDTLYLHKYRINAEAIDNITLPEYKASSIRGVFGHAFKKVVCIQRQVKECSECLLKHRCCYAYVFETFAPEGEVDKGKFKNAPRPFVITPPLSTKRQYEHGEPLTFEITLIGKANDYLPYFVYTFSEMGKNGIGKGNGRFRLCNIEAVFLNGRTKPIFSIDDGILKTSKNKITINDLSASESADYKLQHQTLSFVFETPLRLEEDNRLVRFAPPFRLLLDNIIRRANLLSYFHCGVTSKENEEILSSDHLIRIKSSYLKWIDRDRYSNRKEKRCQWEAFLVK